MSYIDDENDIYHKFNISYEAKYQNSDKDWIKINCIDRNFICVHIRIKNIANQTKILFYQDYLNSALVFAHFPLVSVLKNGLTVKNSLRSTLSLALSS